MQTRLALVFFLLSIPSFIAGQTQPPSDPQAVTFAAQSIAALTGGTSISDVTLTGTSTWYGSGTAIGTATLRALGAGESRMDLALSIGTRTEIRDAQTGSLIGQWISPNNSSGLVASQNCWTDAAWFFPVLGSLAAGSNVVLLYVGQETRNGESVQHIQTYLYVSGQLPTPTPQQLSTTDFYLDANTLLPVSAVFNAHPDDDSMTNLSIEVDFVSYQTFTGVVVPTHIQKYQQGNLLVDLVVTGASFNTGLPLSIFVVN